MSQPYLSFVSSRSGHFLTESGYHADVWMDLETLCRRPAVIDPLARELANRLRPYGVDAVCGPLNEGAFVALLVAAHLGCDFTYAERFADPDRGGLFPVRYALPRPLSALVRGRRVAIVNDVISAGSAVRGAWSDLDAHGAQVVAVGALLVLGDTFAGVAEARSRPLEALERAAYPLWTPDECPLCRAQVPLTSGP